jgi:hypothetical protein
MKRYVALLGSLVLGAACTSNSSRLPTSPSVPNTTSPSVAFREITVGEAVTGTLEVHGAANVFELTAPSDGTLVARLTWAPTQGRLALWLADTLSSSSQDDKPPIAGTLTVIAGRKYQVTVADYAAWDYDNLSLPYVLTTDMQ